MNFLEWILNLLSGLALIAGGIVAAVLIPRARERAKKERERAEKCCPKCGAENTMKAVKLVKTKCSRRSQDLGNGHRRYYSLVTYNVTYQCEKCGATRVKTIERQED